MEPISTQEHILKTEMKNKKDCIFINKNIPNFVTIRVKALVQKIEVIEDEGW